MKAKSSWVFSSMSLLSPRASTLTLSNGSVLEGRTFVRQSLNSREIPSVSSTLSARPPNSAFSAFNTVSVSAISRLISPLVGKADRPVSYTHLRAHETKANLVCRLLLEKKKKKKKNKKHNILTIINTKTQKKNKQKK